MIQGGDALAMAFSPCVGSFLGVVIRRSNDLRSVVTTRSRCEACGHPLGPRDLVPVASWLACRGCCRYCDAGIAGFYPAIELAAATIAVWAVIDASGWLVWATCLLGWTLLALAVIDWREFRLPDCLTLPLLAGGLVGAALFDPAALPADLAGALTGFLVIAVVRIGYRRLRGREGIGLGDAKLLAASGAWVGAGGLASIILIASLTGLLACLLAWVRGDKVAATDPLPFGAFLCVGFWMTWLYG